MSDAASERRPCLSGEKDDVGESQLRPPMTRYWGWWVGEGKGPVTNMVLRVSRRCQSIWVRVMMYSGLVSCRAGLIEGMRRVMACSGCKKESRVQGHTRRGLALSGCGAVGWDEQGLRYVSVHR